jgi:peptidoglycan/xylan/chitin deacetylase (PgdA/CDA1 family)
MEMSEIRGDDESVAGMKLPRIVTTSWDDGDPDDLKVAELLHSRDLAGTFYIPTIGYDGRPTLCSADLRSLFSQGFEIGVHGLSHHTLPKFRSKELDREVRICKNRLEDILSAPMQMFSYPKGRYSANVIRYLKAAGYVGARTNEMLAHNLNFDPFKMPTSLQVSPHSKLDYFRNLARAANLGRAIEYVTRFRGIKTWVELGKRLFDLVLQDGGIWHLFGHSWEIENLRRWDGLKELLDYVCKREGVLYIPNGRAVELLPARNHTALPTHLACPK